MTEQLNDNAEIAAENQSIMAHVSLGSNQLEEAISFYDRVLATIGAVRVVEVPGVGVAWGKAFPEFWVQKPHDGNPAQTANGVHFAFLADSPAQVDAFHEAALGAGASCDGPPGPREEYSAAYYGCFLRDLEGNKIEAMYWDFSKAPVTAA